MAKKRGKYGIKQYNVELYTWSPEKYPFTDNKSRASFGIQVIPIPIYCNALPGTQGQDWVTSYDYNIVVTSGAVQRLAYMACDYVV